MSNATDNLFDAEKMIRDSFTGSMEKERTIEICRWLFSLNSKGKDHVIKCYRPKDQSIRFCIDRGHDCEGDRVSNTLITTIKSNFQIHILPPKDTSHKYLKPDGKYYRYIPSYFCRNLPLEDIKKHILESYFTKLEKLGMNLPKGLNKDRQTAMGKNLDSNEIPSRIDIELAESEVRRSHDEVIGREVVLDQIMVNFDKAGKQLDPNWREITIRNIAIWFDKKGG